MSEYQKGLILKKSKFETFEVRKIDFQNASVGKACIHFERRNKVPRFTILRITSTTGQTALLSCIGHNDELDVIKLDLDTRTLLGISTGKDVKLCIQTAYFWMPFVWLLRQRDPAIRLPALLGTVSVFLGLTAMFF